MADDFTREPLDVIEIIQPLCSQVFGVGACEATGEPCWNTDKTCKFRAALDLSETLPLYFVRDEAHNWIDDTSAFQPALAIGAMVSVSVAPTVLNVAGGSRDMSPLGYRGVLNVRIKDFPWNDIGTDPYLSNRAYDPLERGSFWAKWLKRNPFHSSYIINHYSGERGQALSEMTKRQYIIDRIDAGRDGVTIRATDPLSAINQAAAPEASPGVCGTDITDDAVGFSVINSDNTAYDPAPGFVRIGSEIIGYTTIINGGGFSLFSGATRGALGTRASSHRAGERVQRVLVYDEEPVQDIVFDLLTTYGDIDPALIDKAEWDAEKLTFRPTFNLTGYITEPTNIPALLGELSGQALFNLWWDERRQTIRFKAVRPDFEPVTITDNADIKAGSFTIKELPEERASQVFVYYNLRDAAASLTDSKNYASVAVFIDVTRQIQYGGKPRVRNIFARWVQTEALANNIGFNYLDRFKDVRRHVTFDLVNDTDFWTGDTLNIRHFLDTDFSGLPQANNWLITSAQEIEPGSTYRFTAEDNGEGASTVLWAWVDENEVSPDWDNATPEERETVGYWLNDDGTDAGGNLAPFRWL
jgi:hypothetical protein